MAFCAFLVLFLRNGPKYGCLCLVFKCCLPNHKIVTVQILENKMTGIQMKQDLGVCYSNLISYPV